jgi:hypothetical protein
LPDSRYLSVNGLPSDAVTTTAAHWLLTATAARTRHVHPAADLIAHELSTGCPCGPEPATGHDRTGGRITLIFHHSLDGRENDASKRGPAT